MSSDAGLGCGVEPLWDWLGDHSALLAWMFGLSIVSLVLVVVLTPWFVARLPANYFVMTADEVRLHRARGHWVARAAKNVLGAIFLLAGLAMLVLPGQGVLTLLIGLLLVEFPGKRALERRIVRRPSIHRFLDRMRRRRGQPPFVVD